MDKFNDLVTFLKNNGYSVEVNERQAYKFARVTGNNILAGFCTKHDKNHTYAAYSYINGKISADHVDCFDRWRKCPMQLDLPSNSKEMDYVLSQLKHWGSDEGLTISEEYDYEKWVLDYSNM
ncbi:hypothetical protein [Bacillus thuringiensis]|uniref:hypothetical protein n=1 Tax=Bacillus thuringiensis TaxID=1428 RepID=UPI0021D64870|nr:hypothetical protein [Bacillus thuringiensis]MCU7667779.1 hypothetical protein [Bacillus thuringiensis]